MKRKDILFFVDGTQAFGNREVDILNIDLYSISDHKFHSLKGSSALYVKEKNTDSTLDHRRENKSLVYARELKMFSISWD
ncbi:aminotransferase class V-fold PLP-dependent enzyme [Candidatus Coxiella mudrowiae]|uniref:aminotransferase class V-fold PLP-dependent enzyme n=1 Tax=Candidatus Coxiella mudrowiae TaxID=2054173 RepID=UPI0027D34BA4|nr:aminotransferase class V-fold PLP-dependent enzyme [Candidatus Coxiella mudrowiae]